MNMDVLNLEEKYKQRYKSDCECCRFIKRGTDYLGNDCDIFVTTSSEQCLIFRYSDVPSDNRAFDIKTMQMFAPNYNQFLFDEELMSHFVRISEWMNESLEYKELYDTAELLYRFGNYKEVHRALVKALRLPNSPGIIYYF